MCDYCFLYVSLCASSDAAYAIFIYGQRHGVFCRLWSAWQYLVYAGYTYKCVYCTIYMCVYFIVLAALQ